MLFSTISQQDPSSPTRIAAYIVSGIGFLGAGIILKSSDNRVANLTTAAGIWVSAAIGTAIGFKLYVIAIVTVIVASIGLHLIPHPARKKPQDKEIV